MTYTAKTPQETLFELCWHMENQRNTGWYAGDILPLGEITHRRGNIPVHFGIPFDPRTIPVEMRKDILYYSSGHGWRVRKNPHWFTTFCQRFPETVKAWRHE